MSLHPRRLRRFLNARPHVGQAARLGAILWFAWMVGMWLAFFVLLFADELDGLWQAARDLPLVVEGVVWLAFFPWMLGLAVWTSSWATWVRVTLVLCFAVAWTIMSLPGRTGSQRQVRAR